MDNVMSKVKSSGKDLLEGLTNQNSHADELATTGEGNWGSYSDNAEKADDDFLIQRDDTFDATRMDGKTAKNG